MPLPTVEGLSVSDSRGNLKMHTLTPFIVILPLTAALVLPHGESDCTTFAKHLSISEHNATFLNATYYPANSLNVSNTLNKVSFCEVYTSISYGNGNNSLVAATWLPDRLQWNDRFLAVGNGGMAGVIDYAGMILQLNAGLGVAVSGGILAISLQTITTVVVNPASIYRTSTIKSRSSRGSAMPLAFSRQPPKP